MGYMRYHAIVVSASYPTDDDQQHWAEVAHDEAVRLGLNPSPIMFASVNDVRSFFCPPDGSKEGWPESDNGDESRNAFVLWLKAQEYEDGSSPVKWIEVQYGDDGGEQRATRYSQ